MREPRTYRIPVRDTKTKRARYKAIIEPCGNFRLIYVRATTHKEAYERLCDMHLPNDPRPIGSKSNIGQWTDDKTAEYFQRLEAQQRARA